MPNSTLPPIRVPHPSREDRYRAVLQAIAAGRPRAGSAMSGTDAQTLARKVLIEMGDDWTKRGAPAAGDAAEALS